MHYVRLFGKFVPKNKILFILSKIFISSDNLFFSAKMIGGALKKCIRHCLLWLYDKNNSIMQRDAAAEIQEVYEQDAIRHQACIRWLRRFQNGEKSVEDEPKSGRSSESVDDRRSERIHSELDRHEAAGFLGEKYRSITWLIGSVIEFGGNYFPEH